jgi:hypothetical protein
MLDDELIQIASGAQDAAETPRLQIATAMKY